MALPSKPQQIPAPDPNQQNPQQSTNNPNMSPQVKPGSPSQGQDAPVMQHKPIPLSQFQTAKKPPSIPLEPLKMPDTHVTPEYCLEQMARVLEELAEKQEDPIWVQQHITLAESWRGAAEVLLNHAVAGQQMLGDQHLKQQQIDQQHDQHMQQLSHNDQQHFQGMKQSDDQHEQKLKQNDQLHQKNLKHTDQMNQKKLKQTDDQHKVNMDFNKKKTQLSLQQQQQKAKQQTQARKAKSSGKESDEEESNLDTV